MPLRQGRPKPQYSMVVRVFAKFFNFIRTGPMVFSYKNYYYIFVYDIVRMNPIEFH